MHAGNEFNQQQWRHAKPYVQIAEDQLFEAERLAEACNPPAPKIAMVPPPVPVPAPVIEPVQLAANVVFNFDRHTTAEMRPQSRAELDALIAKLKAGITVKAVKLNGHADRLNNTGNVKYNQQLSEKRAITVREYLVAAGVSPALISFEYKGDTEQVADCGGKFKNKRLLEECLLPNRRVAVQVSGVR